MVDYNIKIEGKGTCLKDMAMFKRALQNAINNDFAWQVDENGDWSVDVTGNIEETIDTYNWQESMLNCSAKAWKKYKGSFIADKKYMESVTGKKYVQPTTADRAWAKKLLDFYTHQVDKIKKRLKGVA